ncbi:hypothetical protein [Adlercreutzia aquisgranensis]|uniref:hypothetical protein n=1 Tax=Adlercreutzia aquisgranensis TaxID=2941323 RepID=UPI0020425312|nr:hypothetical protein [Adlercreutzia aquisgranensis]
MFKKVLSVVLAACVSPLLFGCSSSSEQQVDKEASVGGSASSSQPESAEDAEKVSEPQKVEKEETAEPEPLVLSDYGYVVSDNGYIHYAVEIENPNASFEAEFPVISVVGKNEDGSIAFSDDWTLGTIAPGSKTYWATQAGNGNVTESTAVEFSIKVDKNKWKDGAEPLPSDLYTFDNVSVADGSYWGLQATGEITMAEEVKVGYGDSCSPMLVCILRNGEGSIVTGFNSYLQSDLVAGEAAVFDFSSSFDAEYATAEMHANPWM